ncbi:MAG: hypothetical protein KC418_18620 [Anaerolineales bacterium]|nr:hypothetical protein [Anaerolineales bacterium]MCB8951007.1 DNA methyltransferase [Ardenticatenales bacterium]
MAFHYEQQPLPLLEWSPEIGKLVNADAITNHDNVLQTIDKPFHDWYRFVLSFPPHLVRDYLRDFDLQAGSIVLDPFCGTGTTLVEAKLNQIPSIGIEANPFAHFASCVKTNWNINPQYLESFVEEIAAETYTTLLQEGIDDRELTCDPAATLSTLKPQAMRAIIKNSISPLPLHKTLTLLDKLNTHRQSPAYQYGLLALGNALTTTIGNLRFGPEVGVGKIKSDIPVVAVWQHEMQKMLRDLRHIEGADFPTAQVHLGDARQVSDLIPPNSIDAVITSPPYPNEKDYTRTTRLESVLLGFFTDMAQLRTHKKRLLRSNTRGVYKYDNDDEWIKKNRRIQAIAEEIENRRIELGKTSGFERLYARVARLYFGGMAKHLSKLTKVLKPNARLAYVVGDQASYLRVMIRTGELLAEIACEIGYEVERIDLFRTRFATATQTELREEVVVLHWTGESKHS